MRYSRLDVGVLVVIAALGLTTLPLPFTGDQALFTVGAREMADGSVLYRDFWDVKQPGIFLYYLGGGWLFGFDEVGLHAFDLITLLGFAVVLQVTLRSRMHNAWVASVAPLVIIGGFYVGARIGDVGQIELLVGFPLYLCLIWSLPRSGPAASGSGRLFLSGLAGGIVVLLKLVYLPIAAVFWGIALVDAARRSQGRQRVAAAARVAVPVAAGLAVPVGLALVYIVVNGQLGEVVHTYFEYTPRTTGIAGRPFSRLVDSIVGDGRRFVAMLALAVVGTIFAVRRMHDRFVAGVLAWAILAVPLYLGQHWWDYQLKLFLVPVGVLAAYGLDELWDRRHRVSRTWVMVLAGGLVLLAVPALTLLGDRVLTVARHDFGLTASGRRAIAVEYESAYGPGREWAEQLDEPGPVYVLGNPVALLLSDRDQAIRTNGWSPEQFDDGLWNRLADELETARPQYLLIDDSSAELMDDRAPATRQRIDELYCATGGSGDTVWYELRAVATCEGA